LLIPPPISLTSASFYELYSRGTLDSVVTRDPDGVMYCKRGAKFVAVIPDGRALAPNGSVVTPDRVILGDLSPEFVAERYIRQRHTLLSTLRLPPVFAHPGRVAVLATLASNYYGHWMMDLLPRVELLRTAGFALDDFDAFYLPLPVNAYERDSLAAAGISDRIIDSREHQHLQAAELVVPAPTAEVFCVSRYTCEYLNRLFGPPAGWTPHPDAPRRLLLTRSRATYRRIVNSDEVEASLAGHGFVTVEPEAMTLPDKARLFAGADVVVTPMGSVCANYVYCRPGAAIIEIQNSRAVQTPGPAAASVRGCGYGYLLGQGIQPAASALAEDMRVDPEALLALIHKVVAATIDRADDGELPTSPLEPRL
jgi:hypothetical protein